MAEITLDITSNVKGFLRGVQDSEQALDKVAGTLDDVARDGDKATEKLERSFRELADASKKESKKIGDNFTDNSRRGFGKAGEAARNFKDEARQNFAEVASSFDGTMQGVANGIQGTLGGAAVAVGGAAGLALGTLGIVTGTVLQKVQENAAASEKRVDEMYAAFIESGLNYLTEAQKLDAAKALIDDPAAFEAAKQQAAELGVAWQDVVLAQISTGEQRSRLMADLSAQIEDYNAKLADGTYTDGTRLTLLEGYLEQYRKLNGEQNTAVQQAEGYRDIAEQITGQQKLTNEEIQIQNRRLAETPRTLPVVLDVDRTAIDRALEKRTLRIDLEGYTRTGQRVI